LSLGGNCAGDAVRPWELLGVDRDASENDVRAAFRRLSRRTHPDAGGTGGLYRALVDARDAMLDGAGSPQVPPAADEAAARPQRGPRPRRSRRPPQDDWVVTDEDPHAARRHEAPPQPPPRQAPAEDSACGGRAAAPNGGFLATLARLPGPRTGKGWVRLIVVWLVVCALMQPPPNVVGALVELVVGWLPIVMMMAALARRYLRRRDRRLQ
jgi:hypothetical protein